MTRSILTLFGYLALTALVLLMTIALVSYGQGYSYDFKTHRLTHNGLVIIATQPSGAVVKVDSKFGTKKTPYHASFEEGNYRFNVTKSGYEPWTKLLNVVASQVSLAQYIMLIPKNHPSTVLDRRVQITQQTITRDHRHLAYIVPGVLGGLYTLDLASNKVNRIYHPIAATETVPDEVLTNVSWSDDSSHLILGSNLAGVHTVRLITASNGSVLNLTDKFHFDFTTLQFSARDWRQLYWISPEGLRRLDAGNQTITTPLAVNVRQFIIAGDRVLYVQSTELGESLGALDTRDHAQTIVQALVKSPSYSIKYESYQGQDILAVVPSSNHIATMYTNIFSADITAKVVAQNVTDIAFSIDGHLVSFYSPYLLISYDLEQSGLLARSVSFRADFPAGKEISALSYYDGHHLLLNQNGHVYFVEYDGQNSVELGKIAIGTVPYRFADQRAVIITNTHTDNSTVDEISIR